SSRPSGGPGWGVHGAVRQCCGGARGEGRDARGLERRGRAVPARGREAGGGGRGGHRARPPHPGSARRGNALRAGRQDRTLRDRARGAAVRGFWSRDLRDPDGGGLLRPRRPGGAGRRLRCPVSGRLAGGLLPAVAGPGAGGSPPHDAELIAPLAIVRTDARMTRAKVAIVRTIAQASPTTGHHRCGPLGGEEPAGDVTVAAVVGEEEDSAGTRALVARGIDADRAVLAEPTAMQLVVGNRGLLNFRVIVKGASAHASSPGLGRNAITAAARI